MKFYLFFILSLMFLAPPQMGQYRLTVTVSGLVTLKGDMYISLHNRPEYFQEPDSSFMKMKIAVKSETEVITFDQVPEGKYAIAIYHDENMNGLLETNERGIPREGYGFSGKNKMFGRPKFEQAEFEVVKNDTVKIKMVYLQ